MCSLEQTSRAAGKRTYRVVLLLVCLSVNSGFAFALDDPTRPPGYPLFRPGGQTDLNQWNVSQIMITATRRRAVINGRRVRVGDSVSGARVVAIYPDEVLLEKKSRSIVAPLLTARIKKQIRVIGQ